MRDATRKREGRTKRRRENETCAGGKAEKAN
jgi:hypothetical protein